MTPPPATYHPVSCEFHDTLEALATTKRPAQIRFTGSDGVLQERNEVIRDVFSRGGAEYVVIGSGETVRLDQLVQVDAARATDFPR
jgi:Rho-binding antiterminator